MHEPIEDPINYKLRAVIRFMSAKGVKAAGILVLFS